MATEKSFQRGLQLPISNVSLLGITVSRGGMGRTLQLVQNSLQIPSARRGYICFVNVHTLTEGQYSSELNFALNGAWMNVADGVPLVWFARFKGQPIESRVCGPDFMVQFFSNNPKLRQGFIGGAPDIAQKIATQFSLDAVCYSPPMRPFSEERAKSDWETFLNLCPNRVPPAIVWVGLGAPKQELWMAAVSMVAPETLFMGVGAAFDFVTENKKRAPLWMQKTGMEWLYRLISEPQRLWKRYLITNTLFIFYATRELFRGNRVARS